MSLISEFAVIDPSASIADDVKIGPWTEIGPNVVIGAGCHIASHVRIEKNTALGANTHVYSHVALGTNPQHVGYDGSETWLKIGDNNVIREFVTMNRGTQEFGTTTVGNDNYFMSYSHVAHDCTVGDRVIFANLAQIAGHVKIGNYCFLAAYAGIHQFITIGEYCFLGRATKVYQDIPPFLMVTGNPGAPRGLNSIGLRRHGFTPSEMAILKQAYLTVYKRGLSKEKALESLQLLAAGNQHIQGFIDSISASERGIAREGIR